MCIFSENTCSSSIYLVLKQALILSKNVTANKFIIHVQHAYKHQIVYTGSLELQSINRWYYRIQHLSWIECHSLRYSQDTGYVNKYLFLHIPVIPRDAKLFLINIISSYLHQFIYCLMFIYDESTKIYNVYLINTTQINIASICINPCILIILCYFIVSIFLWSYC